ncbi:MAG: hypothetical protein WDZ37_03560 [Solirubrobacterales bacterium]
MAEVHLVVGVALLVFSLAATVWGAAAWMASRPSVWFWYLLRAAQVVLVLQILLGGLLLASGHETVRDVHYLYGLGALVVSFAAESMRAGSARKELPGGVDFETLSDSEQRSIALRIVRRETGLMTIAALLILAFAFRAAQTSGGLF